jgi:GNAT superfamily N-acetyltransferase
MDFIKVTGMLTKAYWCEGIKIDEVKAGAVRSAVVVGAFLDGEQIGYARAVSDLSRIAILMDVYVDERYRRQGVGQRMVRSIQNNKSLKDVRLWILKTRDAHGVYAKCGFQPLADPTQWMTLQKPRPES